LIFSIILTIPFLLFGKQILSLLPNGNLYSSYWWAIPWLIGINVFGTINALFSTTEISCYKFGFLKWMIPLECAYPLLLLLTTGYGYFVNYLPNSWTCFLRDHSIYHLDTMLWWMTAIGAIKSIACITSMLWRKSR
jgi:hypothetical protein